MATKGHGQKKHRDWSIPLVRIAGIQVRVHLTFFILVALFAVGSSGPEGPGALAGVTWLTLIFSCVLVHELAHSLLARSRGATVRSIVLLPIGGVSQLEHLPEDWNDEFAVAAVGPAASFAIAAAAAAIGLVASTSLWPPALIAGSFIRRLVWFNLLIGAFNLLPAFPLDGGRVFRALLERSYDRETATRRAALMGRWLAVGMGLVGLVWNVWLVLIAVFVFFGATAEEQATIVHIRLQGLRVRDVMRVGIAHGHPAQLLDPTVPVLHPDDPVEGDGGALEKFSESEEPELPVVDHGQIVGLLAVNDLASILSKRPARGVSHGDA